MNKLNSKYASSANIAMESVHAARQEQSCGNDKVEKNQCLWKGSPDF